MDKLKYRDLQRWSIDDVLKVLPVSVTRDSQATMVILTTEDYNKLVQLASPSHDSQAIPIYNKSIHKPGDVVRVWQGKVLVQVTVPELDIDGNLMYNE